MQKIEIIDNQKFPKSFQSYLGNSNNKTNLVITADRVRSQRSERIYFYCNHEEADTKMFAYVKFLCDNIRLNRI